MITFKNRIIGGLLAAAVVGAAIAPTAAEAGHRHHGAGTAAAVVGVGALGLIAGSAIANNNRSRYDDRDDDGGCYLERRRYEDQYGRTYFKRIEVCE